MYYELSFTRRVALADPDFYINDCCRGGEQVRDYLQPIVEGRFERIQTGQEDWRWYLWFRRPLLRLAIDIYTDDFEQGAFRVRLSSRKKEWFFYGPELDTPELEELKNEVVARLSQWAGKVEVELV